MKLTGAAILVSRGMKVLQAAPAAYPYRSATEIALTLVRPGGPTMTALFTWKHTRAGDTEITVSEKLISIEQFGGHVKETIAIAHITSCRVLGTNVRLNSINGEPKEIKFEDDREAPQEFYRIVNELLG